MSRVYHMQTMEHGVQDTTEEAATNITEGLGFPEDTHTHTLSNTTEQMFMDR